MGAIRLPNNTFKGNANTEVVTDVIFLRKNTTGEKKNPNINSLVSIPVKHKNTGNNTNILVNQYFIDNPENVIGEFMAGGLESRDDMTVVVDKDTNIAERMRQVIKDKFPVGIYQVAPKAASKTQKATNTTKLKSGKSKPSGSAKLITSNIQDVEDGNLFIDETDNQPYLRVVDFEDGKIPLPKNAKVEKVNGIIRIKNTLNRQYELETGDNNESEIEANRKELLSAYNDFITTFGRLNDKNNAPLIKKDINGFNILSLENVDRDTKNVVSTADIFKKRVILPKVLIESAEDINDAISISYNEFGHVNIQRVAQLLSSTPEQVMNENYGILFYDTDNSVVTRSEYLSGNVKKKLREATKAAQSNPLFEKNVEALTEVIPEDIPAAKIEVNLGVRWVPAETYADFASNHLFNTTVKVRYNSLADAYGIESYSRSNFDIDTKWAVKDKNGITRADGLKIFENALMQKPTVIYDKLDDDKTVVNKELSERAREKMELMIEEFQKWIWADIDRREKLGRLYNDINNNTVRRMHDGSLLRFDGMNADITLDPHQKDGIAMLINNVGGIIDHIVGAGKTYLMITAAIKMKQLGIVKKPLIIGLKSTIPHLKSDALKLYPTAKILTPTETDFTAQKRKQLLSKIQNNDWDLIILSHEQFQSIPQSAEFQMEITQEELNEIDETLERAERERGKSASKKELSGLETRRKNLVAKLQKLADIAKDKEILDFKRIGIDKLFVDESQQFKNLEYSTRITRVAGLGNPTGSKRAFNMLTAIRTLQHLHQGDKGTTFLSGTPISNSLVEMYLLFKYLRPSKLKEAGYNTFDAWVTQFAVQNTELESSVTGQMKMNTRFREFINLPELSMMYNEIADVRNDDNLKLPKPKMRGGKPILVVVPQSPDQLYWTDRIVEFAKQPHGSRDGSLIGKSHLTESQQSAAMLMASTLSNKLSIDIRLIDRNYDENPNGKIAAVVKNIVQEYKNSESIKGTQMIFCDTGTPKSDKMNELLKDYMEDELNISDDEISQIFGDNPEVIPTITKIKEKLTTVLEWSNEEIEYHLSQAKESQGVFNVYAETKRKLIAEGIPEHEIKFIHDFKTSKAKEDLFKDFNNGTARVLIGSTQKLGTGVNAQKRIVALHHLDAQWNPAAMEQRNGRGLRRGNINEEVAIYQYGTERTQDAYKYDLIDKKGKFISQIKSGAIGDVRSMKQEDEMDAESMTAMLSGDPLTINRIKVSKQVDKLKRSEKNFRNERFVAESKLKKTEAELPPARNSIPRMQNDIALLKQNEQRTEDGQLIISGVVNGVLYDKPKELGEAINVKKKEILKRPVGHTQTIGSINGFTLTGTVSPADLAGTVFKVTLTISNDLSYHIGESSDPVQQVLAIRRHFNSLQSRLDTKIEDINRMEQNIIKLREELDKKWDKQDEYEKAIATLKEIDDKIRQQNEEENKNTGTGNSRGNDEEFDTDVDEYTNGSDGTPGPRFQKATERINVAIANAKELAGSIKQRIADSGPEGIAAAASELATTNPYISKYIPAAATEPVDVEMGTLLDMPADERAKVVLEEMGADTVALNELSEKLFAYGMRTINQPKPLNANQALAISKILQKVFPNVQMFTNEQQYKNALAQIQKDGFQVDYVSAGFIYNGKMYINPAMVSSSTQIHELIHIFTSWAYKYSPATYSKLISVAQQAPEEVIAYIRNEYPELEYNSDRFWEEVFTTFAGEQLSERVMSAIESEQGKKWHTRVLDALKEIVSRFTAAVRNSMGIGLPELKEKDVSAMSIGEFVDYVGGKLLSGNKISDITSEDVKEIEAIRESLKDFPAGTSMLAADEMIKLAAAKELLAKGMPIRRIRTNTGWSINPKGSWEYNESHTYKEYQNEENKDLIKTQVRAQKVAKDVAQINNTPALEAIMNQIIASSAGNPQVVTDLTRIVFQEYVDTLRYEKRAKGRPYLSQAFIDVFYDDAEMEQVSNYLLNPADITLTKQQQEVFNKLFNYSNNSVLNKYKDWIEANNYTVLEQDANGDIQQKIFRLDDAANRNEILEEKEKLTSSDTDKGWLGKLFNLSVGGKKIGSIMPKNLLFRHLWNEKTIAEMLSAKGKALYEILVTSIESARKIAMPLRTVALYFEKNLLEKYSDISIYGNKTTYSQVEKMQITAKDGSVYDLSAGEALSIVMSAHTQMADGYVKIDGKPGFSAVDATMKIENYKGERDIEFSLTQEEFDRIENELLSGNFLDGKTKMLYEELKEYYNREEFIDVNGNTDTSKLSLFGAVQKVFEIDNAKQLSKSNLYFPIQTYESQRDLNRSTLANESQLLDDVSILHDRSKKVNNIIIKDAIQSLHEFNDKSLNFVEYWLPTRNIDTFVNRNGQWLRNNGMEYIVDNLEEFAKNLNNYDKLEYEANKGITNKPVKGLLSAFAVSRLSFNLFTALKQFWGYPIAMGLGIIDDKYLAKQLPEVLKEMGVSYGAFVREFQNYMAGKKVSELADIEPYKAEISKNPYAYDILYRLTNPNLYNMNDIILQSLGADKYSDSKAVGYWSKFVNFFSTVGMSQILQADAAIIIGLYKSAEAQVKETMPQLSQDEQYKEIAKLASEAMYATQQTNVLSDKTQMQLSHSVLDKLMSIFTAQSQKMINTIAQQWIRYAKEEDADLKEKYGRQFIFAANNMFIGNAMYMALVTTLAALIRGTGGGEEDDALDKKFIDNFKWNFIRELAGYIPGYAGEMGSFIVTHYDNQVWSDKFGGVDVYKGANNLFGGLLKVADSFSKEDEEEQQKKMYEGIDKAMSGLGDVTGISQELLRQIKLKEKE
ncbi:MAG: helicase-related protein [Smithella sp.]